MLARLKCAPGIGAIFGGIRRLVLTRKFIVIISNYLYLKLS